MESTSDHHSVRIVISERRTSSETFLIRRKSSTSLLGKRSCSQDVEDGTSSECQRQLDADQFKDEELEEAGVGTTSSNNPLTDDRNSCNSDPDQMAKAEIVGGQAQELAKDFSYEPTGQWPEALWRKSAGTTARQGGKSRNAVSPAGLKSRIPPRSPFQSVHGFMSTTGLRASPCRPVREIIDEERLKAADEALSLGLAIGAKLPQLGTPAGRANFSEHVTRTSSAPLSPRIDSLYDDSGAFHTPREGSRRLRMANSILGDGSFVQSSEGSAAPQYCMESQSPSWREFRTVAKKLHDREQQLKAKEQQYKEERERREAAEQREGRVRARVAQLEKTVLGGQAAKDSIDAATGNRAKDLSTTTAFESMSESISREVTNTEDEGGPSSQWPRSSPCHKEAGRELQKDHVVAGGKQGDDSARQLSFQLKTASADDKEMYTALHVSSGEKKADDVNKKLSLELEAAFAELVDWKKTAKEKEEQAEDLTKEVAHLKDLLTRQQKIVSGSEEKEAHLRYTLAEKDDEVKLLQGKHKEVASQADELQQQVTCLTQDMQQVKAHEQVLNNVLQGKEEELARLNKEIQTLRLEKCEGTQLAVELRSAIDKASQEKIRLEAEHSRAQEHIQQKEKEIEILTGSLASTQNDVLELKSHLTHEQERCLRLEGLTKQLQFTIHDLRGSIRVHCRVRPQSREEIERGQPATFSPSGTNTVAVLGAARGGGCANYAFDHVYGSADGQEAVFADAELLIRGVIDGYDASIIAYGQTGSGKTYSMMGPTGQVQEQNCKQAGITLRALELLFTLVNTQACEWDRTVFVEMLQVYNESIHDLLGGGSVDVSGRTGTPFREAVASVREAALVISRGLNNRAVQCTAMNAQSSRSHCLVILRVEGRHRVTGERSTARLQLVDLAGSERVSRSQVEGERLAEAKAINKSLSALGDVLTALVEKRNHVPFRNSKLTHLLQSSLEGKARVLMLAHVSPDQTSVSETVSTLVFAGRCKEVELGAVKRNSAALGDLTQQVAGQGREISSLQQQLQEVRRESAALAAELTTSKEQAKQLAAKLKQKEQRQAPLTGARPPNKTAEKPWPRPQQHPKFLKTSTTLQSCQDEFMPLDTLSADLATGSHLRDEGYSTYTHAAGPRMTDIKGVQVLQNSQALQPGKADCEAPMFGYGTTFQSDSFYLGGSESEIPCRVFSKSECGGSDIASEQWFSSDDGGTHCEIDEGLAMREELQFEANVESSIARDSEGAFHEGSNISQLRQDLPDTVAPGVEIPVLIGNRADRVPTNRRASTDNSPIHKQIEFECTILQDANRAKPRCEDHKFKQAAVSNYFKSSVESSPAKLQSRDPLASPVQELSSTVTVRRNILTGTKINTPGGRAAIRSRSLPDKNVTLSIMAASTTGKPPCSDPGKGIRVGLSTATDNSSGSDAPDAADGAAERKTGAEVEICAKIPYKTCCDSEIDDNPPVFLIASDNTGHAGSGCADIAPNHLGMLVAGASDGTKVAGNIMAGASSRVYGHVNVKDTAATGKIAKQGLIMKKTAAKPGPGGPRAWL